MSGANPTAVAILVILAWGTIASLVMVAVMYASQSLGWTRLNFPFLLGTAFTNDRAAANNLGFLLYMIAGLLFAFLYYLLFALVRHASWWIGLVTGFVHGLLVLTAALPLLSYMHPRIASAYDGPDMIRRLEPPGFLALHYGRRTPLITLLAHTVYGLILGIGFSLWF